MKRFFLHPLCLTIPLIVLMQITAEARFAAGEHVPIDRLITNVSAQLEQKPDDTATIYTLGRLHSLAFAGSRDVMVFRGGTGETANQLPTFGPYGHPNVKPDTTLDQRKKEALEHLRLSLQLYHRANELAPKDGLILFSYGWMLEQAAPFATEVDAPFLAKPGKADKAVWIAEALKAYRQAFALRRKADLQLHGPRMGRDNVVSGEAGQAILDYFKTKRSLTKAESAEKEDIEAHLKRIDNTPHAITPIIFPLHGAQSLASLTATQARVRFNLSGDPTPHVWPWVTPQTGILVWDPKRTGRITSGKQLFGNVTWWIFWRNGYEPLAALDNNRDGVLTGPELSGIAVWQDKNSNGYSDPGEVTPVQKFGVRQIAVHPVGLREGVLAHPCGLVMQDGSTRPLYDWTPTSLPATAP